MKILHSTTSSKGNCSVIENGNGHLLIIDAGLKYKVVDKAIGYTLHKADALLITHAHSDHTACLNDFIISGINTFLGEETRSKLIIGPVFGTCRVVDKTTRVETSGFIAKTIEMVHTNHDGTTCECYGFLIFDKSTGEKMLWATDTQYIKNKFPPLEFYCIESNFFEYNDYNENNNYIEKIVEQRRVQSHMSFESAVKFLKMQDLSKCKEIRLLHLSNSLSENDKKKIKRKLKSELRNKIKVKEVNIVV